jgi:hypothetical protein
LSDIRNWLREPVWPRPGIGHNSGPPLEDEPPGKTLFVRYCWEQAHKAAWRAPSRDIVLFRLRRAEAAGVSYHEYMLELLDTGRHLQREDVERRQREREAKAERPPRRRRGHAG